MPRLACALLALALVQAPAPAYAAAHSQCYGTSSHGRLEGGVKLPPEGLNFSAYSKLGATVGRTYVHAQVAALVLTAYGALARSHPAARFVYGETGFPDGGRFKPHQSHQNGRSVDFFVPVKTTRGTPADLPSSWSNKFGYDIEFDASGRFQHYQIDFDAYAEHLYQLHLNAQAQAIPLTLVIVDPAFLPLLFGTRRGAYLREKLPFMAGKPSVRHDEHFHVEFGVPCAAMP